MAMAVRLTSAPGRVPASSTMISAAHHSEIIRKLGTARRKNCGHPLKASFDSPCQEFSKSLNARQVLKITHNIRRKFPTEVAMAAPR